MMKESKEQKRKQPLRTLLSQEKGEAYKGKSKKVENFKKNYRNIIRNEIRYFMQNREGSPK